MSDSGRKFREGKKGHRGNDARRSKRADKRSWLESQKKAA